MSKNFKKIVAIMVLVMMAVSIFTACSEKAPEDTTDVTDDSSDTTQDQADDETKTDDTSDDEVVSLKWIQVGSGLPDNYDEWKASIDEYLEEKIGVNIDMEIVPWGDWDERRRVIINAGEDFDIFFTDINDYVNNVELGAYMDITDLLEDNAPELLNFIPADYWEATKINDRIYSVPTYKDSSVTHYFVWDKEKAEEYGIDYENINDFAGLDEALRVLQEKEGGPSLLLESGGFYQVNWEFDSAGIGEEVPLGVRYDDESREVVYIYESPEVMERLEYLHEWYKDGIINADAAAVAEGPNYKPFSVAQGWKSAAKTVWGPQQGVDVEAVQFSETVVSNDTVRGSLNAISSNSAHPGKALQFLELVNLDTKVRDAFYYGLEGDNFEYVDDKINKLNDEWTMAGYTQGTFFTVSQTVEEDFNQWDEVQELNENAKPSVLLGFTADTSSIEDEIANCSAIHEKYKSELLTGTKDPKQLVPAMLEELKAAGFDTIIETVQQQIDEAFDK